MEQAVLWTWTPSPGLDYCEWKVDRLQGHIIAHDQSSPIFVSYVVEWTDNEGASAAWVSCRNTEIRKNLHLKRGTRGQWWRENSLLPQFEGLADIDLGISPATNTLPLRRLSLAVGQKAELTALWVRFPDLSLARLNQRYTRLRRDTYLYESLESGYTAELRVDENFRVITYGDVWKRVGL